MENLKVRIKVEGGVATVWACPKGIEVEITDYDTDDDRTYSRWTVGHNLKETIEEVK
jgi:hypothetical protein